MKERGILMDRETNDLDIKVVRDREGKIVQGVQVGDVTQQNMAIIIQMHPGEMKEQPTVGVGISNMLLDKDRLLYKHRIRQQLDADGFRINFLNITDIGEVQVDANYK